MDENGRTTGLLRYIKATDKERIACIRCVYVCRRTHTSNAFFVFARVCLQKREMRGLELWVGFRLESWQRCSSLAHLNSNRLD